MHELRHWYDHAAVSNRITQPPFAELADRGRRRARRIRTVRGAGVAVFAALIAAPLLTLPTGNQPVPPGAASEPPFEPAWERLNFGVSFFDLRNGVAHYNGEACGEQWLSVTQDGGTTWSELREAPKVPGRSGVDADDLCVWPVVVQIAPNTLVTWAATPAQQVDRPSLISHDAGRTWREYESQVRIADSVPEGAVPSWPCDHHPQCVDAGLGWYDPQTGDWMVLRNQPLRTGYDALTVGLDGSIWVSGFDPSGNELHLAVSLDRGRTWLDRPLLGHIDWLAVGLITAYDGDTAYLCPMVGTPETDPFELYRTVDGGETWHPMPAAQQFEDVVGIWTNRAGGLVVTDMTRDVHLSTDGGESFSRTELPVWLVLEITGGFQATPRNHSAAISGDVYLSEDGLIWQPVHVPYWPDPDNAPSAQQSIGG